MGYRWSQITARPQQPLRERYWYQAPAAGAADRTYHFRFSMVPVTKATRTPMIRNTKAPSIWPMVSWLLARSVLESSHWLSASNQARRRELRVPSSEKA